MISREQRSASRQRSNELVQKHINERRPISRTQQEEYEAEVDTFGERAADAIASFGGSWPFIGLFVAILVGWVLLNSYMLAKPFDPFPYILLNLMLSMVAALQAPVILMSQNRQAEKDRERADDDFEVNLKAEIEIYELHEKIDRLTKMVEALQRTPAGSPDKIS
jgi:uncharacterized membrane protein